MVNVKAVKIGSLIICLKLGDVIGVLKNSDKNIEYVLATDNEYSFQFDETNNNIIVHEWQSYYIQSINDKILNESLFINRGRLIDNNIGELFFKNSIGKSKFEKLDLIVKSSKLSNSEFEELLKTVDSKISNLTFSYNVSGVGSKVIRKKQNLQQNEYLRFKYLAQFFEDHLKPWLESIVKQPHRLNLSRREYEKLELAPYIDEESMVEIFSGSNQFTHSVKSSSLSKKLVFNGKEHIPLEISHSLEFDTYDNVENRFIKFLVDNLSQLINVCKGKYDIISNHMLENIDIISIKKNLWYYSNRSVLRDCKKMSYIPFSSQVVQKKTPYNKALRFYQDMNSLPVISFSEDTYDEILELKKIDKLYEYYCFFKLEEILDDILNAYNKNTDYKEVINGSSIILSSPETSYQTTNKKISLFYQKTYKKQVDTYSISLDPDFSIEIVNLNTNELEILVLDSKFKSKYELVKSEDIHKMHTYKDAIINCNFAIALFPGSDNVFYPESITSLFSGVGAYVLKPNFDNSDLKTLLNEVLCNYGN
ncbi:hypothetical protein KUL118_32650 [Tenacibaculum sp. KUL118]|nr:hypothetical protein KUL118_32650 [Tenacibaculum sp. KUL118]